MMRSARRVFSEVLAGSPGVISTRPGNWLQEKLEGVTDIGGQEHFYFESQAAIAYPGENGSLRVHASTQNPTELQTVIAAALNLGMHAVVCECRRMGGAFGGKETQAAIPAFLAALVAQQNKPCGASRLHETRGSAANGKTPSLSVLLESRIRRKRTDLMRSP